MLLSERSVRSFIRESLLTEGVADDLSKMYPDITSKIRALNPKSLKWFNARFGVNKAKKEIHQASDAIVTLKLMQDKDSAIGQKFRENQQFRDDIARRFPEKRDDGTVRPWTVPNDISEMTADDMSLILRLFDKKKLRFDFKPDPNVEEDRIGKIGPWNIWIPSTKERSIQIAGFDPDTMEPYTTWCTTRLGGDNLFYNYTGLERFDGNDDLDSDVMLVYVIRDNPKSDSDWLSIGFVDRKIVFNGDGTESVDRDNIGLNRERLKSILGADFSSIMSTIQKRVNELKGVSPAKKKVKDAAESVDSYRYLMSGLSKSGSKDLKSHIVNSDFLSKDVEKILFEEGDPEIIYILAQKSSSPYIIESLANDLSPETRGRLLYNKFVSAETKTEIIKSLPIEKINEFRYNIDNLLSTDHEVIADFARSRNVLLRFVAAMSRHLSPTEVEILSRDESPEVRTSLLRNRNEGIDELILSSSPSIIDRLASDSDPVVRAMARRKLSVDMQIEKSRDMGDLESAIKDRLIISGGINHGIPDSVLLSFVDSSDDQLRMRVARSVTDEKALEKLARDDNRDVVVAVIANKSTPANVIELLADHPDFVVRRDVVHNPKISIGSLKKLAQDESASVRGAVGYSRQLTPSIASVLIADKDPDVRYAALTNHTVNFDNDTLDDIAKNDPNRDIRNAAKTLLSIRVGNAQEQDEEDEYVMNEMLRRVIKRILA